MEFLWTITAFILTLMVFSYLIGDNLLFRLAAYIFIGVAAGLVAVLVIYQAILPRMVWPLIYGTNQERLLALVPTVLGVLLLFKLSRRLGRLGNAPMAYIAGAGAAIIIGGAVYGTIIGQGSAAVNTLQFAPGSGYLGRLGESVIILLGTLTSLAYFHFSTRAGVTQPGRRSGVMQAVSGVGQVFISITLGAVYAGVLLAALSALVERILFIIQTVGGLG
ncbi:MAG TPA: hypothetical protein PLI60_10360 [Anaerolineaceae bacterium]|nr:hypothetical protein [Anaerolineaceae bacterium]HPC07108.1 hypothetical protein [Anaerolineaceae bacterium]HQP08555.1 hypothetical protein [Anaerolineaceae bacterium]